VCRNTLGRATLFVLLLVSALGCADRNAASDAESSPTWSPPTEDQVVAELADLTFEAFAETAYRNVLLRSPMALVHTGATPGGSENGLLDDLSGAFLRETQRIGAHILETLRSYDRAALTPDQRLTYDACEWYWDDCVRGHEHLYHDYSVTGYFVTSLEEQVYDVIVRVHPLESPDNVDDHIRRLSTFGEHIDQIIEGLDRRAAAGVVAPRLVLDHVAPRLLEMAEGATAAHPFYARLEEATMSIDALTGADRADALDRSGREAGVRAAAREDPLAASDRPRRHRRGNVPRGRRVLRLLPPTSLAVRPVGRRGTPPRAGRGRAVAGRDSGRGRGSRNARRPDDRRDL